MKKTWSMMVVVLFFSFILVGCSSTAHIEKDDSVDFGQFKTFAWIDKAANDSTRTNDLIEQKVKEIVKQELEKTAG